MVQNDTLMFSHQSPVYLIDSSIYIFRAWFSIPEDVRAKNGQAINAFIGFFDFVAQFLAEVKPEQMVFVFDESLEYSHRNEIYPAYKSNREPAPEELKSQFQLCRDLIRCLGICQIAHNRYEADDLLGTIAQKKRKTGHQIIVVSGDKDLAQIIRDDDIWWNYAKHKRLNYQDIIENLGISPHQVPDWLALSGDAVDNIPGIPGIGKVTASRLLQHFGTLDNLLDNQNTMESIPNLRGAKRIAGLINEHIETLHLSRKLTGIYYDVPLAEDFTTDIRIPDFDGFSALSDSLGLSQHRHKMFERCVERLK